MSIEITVALGMGIFVERLVSDLTGKVRALCLSLLN